MSTRLSRFAALALLGLLVTAQSGCGGAREVALKTVAAESAPQPGPPATKEELDGTVPPLRGLADLELLVPPELVPPEPPSDPDPGFKE
jgi:hypothetical protein